MKKAYESNWKVSKTINVIIVMTEMIIMMMVMIIMMMEMVVLKEVK